MKHYGASSSNHEESPGRHRKVKLPSQKKEKREKKLSTPELEEEDEPLSDVEAGPSSVQKYVEKLSQGLGLLPSPTTAKVAKKRRVQKKDSDSSSEEERWLDAIQSGKLEEVDEELKKVKSKDPKLMTARQRAMLERKGDRDPPEQQLMSLPSGYKEVVMTAEAIQRKAIKSQKRKEKADEKREKDKKKTMERLLKKQESKTMRGGTKRGSRRSGPVISYVFSEEGPRIILPPGVKFPLEATKPAVAPPSREQCRAPGCSNLKRYSCSKTGIPLCSLQCYQHNIDTLILQAFS